MTLRVWIAIAAFAIACAPAGAQKLYKWVDQDGRISYHDQAPPSGSGYRVEEKAVRLGEKRDGAAADIAGKFPVVLYYCAVEKK